VPVAFVDVADPDVAVDPAFAGAVRAVDVAAPAATRDDEDGAGEDEHADTTTDAIRTPTSDRTAVRALIIPVMTTSEPSGC
jgi:hypothetical protein